MVSAQEVMSGCVCCESYNIVEDAVCGERVVER